MYEILKQYEKLGKREIVVENKSPGIIKEMAIVIATYMLISTVYLATFSDLKK